MTCAYIKVYIKKNSWCKVTKPVPSSEPALKVNCTCIQDVQFSFSSDNKCTIIQGDDCHAVED